jgi:hypothetical protein
MWVPRVHSLATQASLLADAEEQDALRSQLTTLQRHVQVRRALCVCEVLAKGGATRGFEGVHLLLI